MKQKIQNILEACSWQVKKLLSRLGVVALPTDIFMGRLTQPVHRLGPLVIVNALKYELLLAERDYYENYNNSLSDDLHKVAVRAYKWHKITRLRGTKYRQQQQLLREVYEVFQVYAPNPRVQTFEQWCSHYLAQDKGTLASIIRLGWGETVEHEQ